MPMRRPAESSCSPLTLFLGITGYALNVGRLLVPPEDRKLMVYHPFRFNIRRNRGTFLRRSVVYHGVVPHEERQGEFLLQSSGCSSNWAASSEPPYPNEAEDI